VAFRKLAVSAALLLGSGCVSSSTWSGLHEIEAHEREDVELDARVLDEHGGLSGPFAFASCEDAARVAVATFPGLEAPRQRVREALAMARADGALPAPSARVEVWDFPIGDPSRADREGMYMLGVAQELPPAGSLDGSARARVEEAREALGELAELRREIASDAAHTCADWSAAMALRERLAAWIGVLDQMRDAVQARYAAGGGALADVARVERERATAERMMRRAEGDAARAEAALRARLGVEAGVALGDAPALPAGPPALERDRVLAFALAHRGLLLAARARIEGAGARVSAAEARASTPTFMLGGQYMQTPQARAGLGLELGMTLPWLWSGERDALEAARAEQAAEEAEVLGLERSLGVDVHTALAALDTLEATLTSLREREAPAAQLALDAVAATYGAGQGTLLDWLDAARAVRELGVEEADLRGELAHALADLVAATGATPSELASAPAPEEHAP
jgi:outer membrane protein TolC